MEKPGKFTFLLNRDIRLAYEYAYRSMETGGLWDKAKGMTLQEWLKYNETTPLKTRKGSSWARTLQVMHEIAKEGWEAVVEKLKKSQS